MKKNELNNFMVFDDFIRLVKESVKETFGVDYTVDINHVIKNNSVELDGLVILKKNEHITPNIYLNYYYEKYLDGIPLEEVLDEIVQVYVEAMNEREKGAHTIQYDFCEMKACIIYRLINYNKNKKLLLELPHIKYLDLAVTFHCLVKNNEASIGTIRITKEHINQWNIDLEELKEAARVNTPKLFPPVVKGMNEVITDILQNEIYTSKKSNNICTENEEKICTKSKEARKKMVGMDFEKINTMYVISNTKGINGASCLLYPGVLQTLSEELGSNLYILPSSLHEIIAVKDNGLLDKESLKEMVLDVNQTQVPKEDILSDSVYYYSRERVAMTLL